MRFIYLVDKTKTNTLCSPYFFQLPPTSHSLTHQTKLSRNVWFRCSRRNGFIKPSQHNFHPWFFCFLHAECHPLPSSKDRSSASAPTGTSAPGEGTRHRSGSTRPDSFHESVATHFQSIRHTFWEKLGPVRHPSNVRRYFRHPVC